MIPLSCSGRLRASMSCSTVPPQSSSFFSAISFLIKSCRYFFIFRKRFIPEHKSCMFCVLQVVFYVLFLSLIVYFSDIYIYI